MTLSLLYNTIWSPLCDTVGTIREWLLWVDVPNWRLEDILHFKYLLQNDSVRSSFRNNMYIIREHVRKTVPGLIVRSGHTYSVYSRWTTVLNKGTRQTVCSITQKCNYLSLVMEAAKCD